MSELHDQESDFSRLLRHASFADAARPEHRDALREQALAAFDEAGRNDAPPDRWKHTLNNGRELMRRPIPRLIAVSAACILVAVIWLLVPGHQSTAQAFHRFAEAIVAAKTARFQMEVAIEGQPKQKFQAYYLAPGKFRQELPGVINIFDFSAGKIVSLMPAEKKAMVMKLTGEPKKQTANDNYFERLRELLSNNRDAKEDQYKQIGEREINGQRAIGFRFDSPASMVTLWGDPATGQPVRIETLWNGLPRTEVTMTDFEVNVDLKESLFDLTLPPDYKGQSMDVDASAPVEKDLVQAFRACSELSGGEFPEALTTAAIMNLVAKFAAKRGKDLSDTDVQQFMKQSITIGRGFGFVLALPVAADAHYAGKGVKLDAKDLPIFWYKLQGTDKYRVIYADLSATDADAAPQVAGAVRIEKAGKTARPAEK
jgi:outer membrane lipoprotein-sorting protein